MADFTAQEEEMQGNQENVGEFSVLLLCMYGRWLELYKFEVLNNRKLQF